MTGKIACPGILAACFILLSSCGGQVGYEKAQVGDTEASESETAEALPVVGSHIEELILDGNDLQVDLNLESNESAALLIVSLDGNGATQGFQLGKTDASLNSTRLAFKEKIANERPEDGDITEIVHQKLRRLEKKIDADAPLAEPRHPKIGQKGGLRQGKFLTNDKIFKVITSFSAGDAHTTVNAMRAYSGENFDIYVDERDYDAFQPGDLETVAAGFDSRIDNERGLFGHESDVDENAKFTVLLTREINALGESYGGLITGYFYATDLYDSATYPSSNESEIIYAMVANPDGELGQSKVSYDLLMNNILPSVLPHEFQHMANFNAHRFLNSTGSEANWINEGLSHLAEDIYSIDEAGYMPFAGIENPSRVSHYLKNITKTCFTCGASLDQRGGAYLFLRYLYEQAELGKLTGPTDGADFLYSLTSGAHRDIRNIANAISGNPADTESFKSALSRFGLAIYLSGGDQDHEAVYEISALNLRAEQDDNRGTVLSGPAILDAGGLPLVETLSGYSLAYVQISGEDLANGTGSLDLQVADASKFKAYLIK